MGLRSGDLTGHGIGPPFLIQRPENAGSNFQPIFPGIGPRGSRKGSSNSLDSYPVYHTKYTIFAYSRLLFKQHPPTSEIIFIYGFIHRLPICCSLITNSCRSSIYLETSSAGLCNYFNKRPMSRTLVLDIYCLKSNCPQSEVISTSSKWVTFQEP